MSELAKIYAALEAPRALQAASEAERLDPSGEATRLALRASQDAVEWVSRALEP